MHGRWCVLNVAETPSGCLVDLVQGMRTHAETVDKPETFSKNALLNLKKLVRDGTIKANTFLNYWKPEHWSTDASRQWENSERSAHMI